MKLTEQEQAAVSRGMIEGLLRALARGRRTAARASGAGARAAVRRPLTCCAWPPIAAFPLRRRTRETRWRISGGIFRSTSARQPDWELVEVYADEGLSGTSSDRPAFRLHAGSGSRREN